MPRLYVSNESYPEMREIRPRWAQHATWWRAFRSAIGDWRFWAFMAALGLQWFLWWIAYRLVMIQLNARGIDAGVGVTLVRLGMLSAAIVVHALLTVTWGGDLMRPHLRRVSPVAREACPACGHRLTDQVLAGTSDHVFCQECGETIPRQAFEPPYAIPRRFLALSWRRERPDAP